MEKQNEVLRVLLNYYTKIGYNGGIAKVIFDDEFENIAEEIVKLFAIPAVVGRSEQLPPIFKTDKEYKDVIKVIYPKDNSKRFRR